MILSSLLPLLYELMLGTPSPHPRSNTAEMNYYRIATILAPFPAVLGKKSSEVDSGSQAQTALPLHPIDNIRGQWEVITPLTTRGPLMLLPIGSSCGQWERSIPLQRYILLLNRGPLTLLQLGCNRGQWWLKSPII